MPDTLFIIGVIFALAFIMWVDDKLDNRKKH